VLKGAVGRQAGDGKSTPKIWLTWASALTLRFVMGP
jgi:hypothetical protein